MQQDPRNIKYKPGPAQIEEEEKEEGFENDGDQIISNKVKSERYSKSDRCSKDEKCSKSEKNSSLKNNVEMSI